VLLPEEEDVSDPDEEDPDEEDPDEEEEEPEEEDELDEEDEELLLLVEEVDDMTLGMARPVGADLAARAKFARLRVPFNAVFSLITATIPAWQWVACEQYNHIGVKLVIAMVKVGLFTSPAETGLKPENTPCVLGGKLAMGWQG